MSYARNTLELTLEHFTLTAPKLPADAHFALRIALIAPRPMIVERSALRTVALQDKAWTQQAAPFYQRVLFKETVQGPFGIVLELSPPTDADGLDRWLREILATAVETAAEVAAVDLATPMRGLIRNPFRLLGRSLRNPDEAETLASGGIDASSEKQPETQLQTLTLTAERELVRTRTVMRGGRRRQVRTTLVAPGSPVAQVQLGMRVV